MSSYDFNSQSKQNTQNEHIHQYKSDHDEVYHQHLHHQQRFQQQQQQQQQQQPKGLEVHPPQPQPHEYPQNSRNFLVLNDQKRSSLSNQYPDSELRCCHSSRTLFVGELPRNTEPQEVIDLFSTYGQVDDVRLKYAKVTKHPLGYGFVEMATHGGAALCLENLDGYFFKDKAITVRWASRNKKLFFANLGKNVSLNDIISLCQNYGSVCPEKSSIHRSDSGNTYAIIEFDKREDAEAARVALNGSVMKLKNNYDTTIFVNWEQSVSARSVQTSPGPSEFPYFSVHVSFRCSLPGVRVTEKMIFQAYKQFGSMTTVSIKSVFIDSKTQLHSGFGFIHFETIEGARNAVNDGSELFVDAVEYIAEFSKHLLKRGEKKQSSSLSSPRNHNHTQVTNPQLAPYTSIQVPRPGPLSRPTTPQLQIPVPVQVRMQQVYSPMPRSYPVVMNSPFGEVRAQQVPYNGTYQVSYSQLPWQDQPYVYRDHYGQSYY